MQAGPVITQIVPSSARAGDQIQMLGSNFAGTSTVYFPGPAAFNSRCSSGTQWTIPTPMHCSSFLGLRPSFPPDAAPGGQLLTSNSIAFTRIPHLRIRANRRDISSGESVQFQSRILGEDLSQSIMWTADIGTISGSGAYTAPANFTTDSFAVVSGCIQATQVCEQFRLGIHPFRLAPSAPIVSQGNSLQLSGTQGSVSFLQHGCLMGLVRFHQVDYTRLRHSWPTEEAPPSTQLRAELRKPPL